MQNITIATTLKFMRKADAVNFLYELLVDDIARTEGRKIQGHKADDTFFNIAELLGFLSNTDFNKFTMSEAVSMLSKKEKAQLFDLLANGDREAVEVAMQRMCETNVLYMFQFKIELLNRLRKAEYLKNAVERYIG